MTSKLRAGIAGAVSGIAAFVSWLVMIPTDQQTKLLLPLLDLVYIEWRDEVGLAMRALATFGSIYAVFQAAQSGPATKPANPINA